MSDAMLVTCDYNDEPHNPDDYGRPCPNPQPARSVEFVDIGLREALALVATVSLEDWWRDTCISDLNATVPKMQEYGALDLVESGRAVAKMGGWEGLTNAELIELGIAYYLKGKIERVMEAYRLHRLPSTDTLKDITVYSLMARAARERGGWGDIV